MALRAEIAAWVAEQRSRGAWWCDLADTVGIPADTLKRWAAPPMTASTTLLPVEVIDAPSVETITLVTPKGLRIEGVSIASAIAILRGLA
jgi:hypothetical protein